MKKRLISTGLLLLLLFVFLEYSPVSTGKEERGNRETKESQEVEVEEKDGSVGKADEEKKGIYEQETIQEIVEMNSPEKKEDTKAHYPETSKEAFLELVKTETGENVCDIFYEDFEGNGEYSAFIFTGEKKEEGSDIEFTGSLWYASREGIMLVEEGIETSTYNPIVLTWGEEKHLLLVRTVDYTESLFWRVEKSLPLLTESLEAYCYSSGEELVAVYSFRSMSVGGRIWQDYYLYWDEHEQCYQEYSGNRISEEEFLGYENAAQLQEEIEQVLLAGYKERMPESIRHEYIRRENGVVNIQFYFEWEEDTDYYYAILREDGKDGLKMDENYSPDMYQEQGFIQEEGTEFLRLQKRPRKEEQEGTDSENKLVMVKEDDSYLIYDGSQLEELARMVAADAEIEPGVPAAQASYVICNDVIVGDWIRLGSAAHPFLGELEGWGGSITGVDFAIKKEDQTVVSDGITIRDRWDMIRPWETLVAGRMEEIREVFGTEGEKRVRELMEKEGCSLGRSRIQRLGNLNSCIFTLMKEGEEAEGYHVLLQGSWQGQQVELTHFVFKQSCDWDDFFMTVMDINFDGTTDLLIYEGKAGIYMVKYCTKGLLWNSDQGCFEEYPSFPGCFVWMEIPEGEIVDMGNAGFSKWIDVYGVVDGEYVKKQEINWYETDKENEKGEKKEEITLSYYEYGELIRTHDLTNEGVEWRKWYPELNYWWILFF